MMPVIGLWPPEMIVVRKVSEVRLVTVFAGVFGAGSLVAGSLFNVLP